MFALFPQSPPPCRAASSRVVARRAPAKLAETATGHAGTGRWTVAARWATCVLWLIVGLTPSTRADDDFLASLSATRAAIYAHGTGDSAESIVHGAATGFDPSRQYFFLVPGDPLRPASGGHPERDTPRADKLYELAVAAADHSDAATAYRLVHEVLQFDPDHAHARRWAGLRASAADNPSAITARSGRRRHARLGWRPGEYLQVTTDHFQIVSNDQQDAVLLLARTLEDLHGVWRQLFFDFWNANDASRTQAARNPSPRRANVRHRVVMFGTREEYVRFIRQVEPQAELTRGYYHAPSRTAYFVGGSEPTMSTWYHEGTHQLFHETAPVVRQVGARHNFWIVEGVALYMESLQRCRQWRTVGGLEAERLQYARFRALREGFYLPLKSLVDLDRVSLQRHPQIRQLYSQAAGLTHFLMDGQQGRYRPALMRYLQQVYQGHDQADTLVRLTETTWEALDEAYLDFLHVDDAQLRRLDPDIRITALCLGGTSISDEGLRSLPTLRDVTWLDLFGTQITDAGTAGLAAADRLEQLNLEQTRISDATVARLAAASGLQQLDLTGTQITDAACATIGQLRQLESLWLTNTRVSDAGVEQLSQLTRLRQVELSGTQVSRSADQQLRRSLPLLSAERP